MAGSLRGGAKIRIAAIGKEFIAATKLAMYLSFMFSGCLRFFVAKGFMKTCLFLVIGEHEGLPLRNNGCEHGKTVEDVSKARMSTSCCAEGYKLNMHDQELHAASVAHANKSVGSRL
nr:hypothetical protein CFP56_10645 [Quercus suber]